MSDGRRYWVGYVDKTLANYAAHRAHGDIPGCVPAVDVFIEDEAGKITVQNKSVPIGHNYYMS